MNTDTDHGRICVERLDETRKNEYDNKSIFFIDAPVTQLDRVLPS